MRRKKIQAIGVSPGSDIHGGTTGIDPNIGNEY